MTDPPRQSNSIPEAIKGAAVSIWRSFRKLPLIAQIVIGFVAFLFVVGGIAGDPEEDKSDENSATQPAQKTAPAETTEAPAGTTDAPAVTTATAAPVDPYKAFGEEQFGDKLVHVSPANQDEEVIYTFKEGDSIDYAFTIEEEFKDAFQAAFRDDDLPNAKKITLIAEIGLIDKFGEESDGPGYSVTMTRRVGKQINWDNRDSLEFGDLWQVNLMRDDL